MSAGVVVWITGLPSSGKSRFATEALAGLRAVSAAACLLDGDAVRASIVPPPGYTDDERANFYETLARLAALLARQGLIVLVPATAHRRAFRARARELAPSFIEVWIDTPASECAARDSKGLYAASRSDDVRQLPGSGVAYEVPLAAEIQAHGGRDPEALQTLLSQLSPPASA